MFLPTIFIVVCLLENSLSEVAFTKIDNFCITNSSSALVYNPGISNIEYIETTNYESNYYSSRQKKICDFEDHESACYEENSAWHLMNSLDGKFNHIVTDTRWEHFNLHRTIHITDNSIPLKYIEVYEFEKNKNDFQIPLSIRAQQEAHLFLCDADQPPDGNCYWFLIGGHAGNSSQIRKCSAGQINTIYQDWPREPCSNPLGKKDHAEKQVLSKNVWLHFKLIKTGTTFKFVMADNFEIVKYNDLGNLFKINHLIIHTKRTPGLWKIHEFWYLYSEVEGRNKLFENVKFRFGYNCVAMYIAMCTHCSMIIEFVAEDNIVKHTHEIKPVKDSTWQEVKISFELNPSQFLQIYLDNIDNTRSGQGFWAIDDVRYCSENEYRYIKSSNVYPEPPSCQLLSSSDKIITGDTQGEVQGNVYKNDCPTSTFSRYCIPCNISNSIGAEDYCDKGKINCELEDYSYKTFCFCTAGYTGYTCKNECAWKKFGHGCQDECTNCDYSGCNNINGVCKGSCINGYSGSKCDTPPGPTFQNPPSVNSVGYTSAKVEVKDFRLTGTSTPKFYQVQYSTDNKKWKDVGQKTEFSIRQIFEINNLEADAEYFVRAILLSDTDDNDDKNNAAVQTFRTSCKNLDSSEIIVKPENMSATIELKITPGGCKLENYRLIPLINTYSDQINNTFFISGLNPYTTYTISFQHIHSKESVQTEFRTKEGAPSKVEYAVVSSRSDTNIDLTWSEPFEKNGRIQNYTIDVQFDKVQDCNEYVKADPKSIVEEVRSVSITNLQPYSCYNIKIYASTKASRGPSVKLTGCTSQNEILEEEEVPTFTFHPKSTSLNFKINWKCNLHKGPIYIYAEAKCINSWCKYSQFREIKYNSNITEFKLEKLYAYSNYTITFKISRTDKFNTVKTKEMQFNTLPDAPGEISNLEVFSKGTNFISLRWLPPYPPNGILKNYKIIYTYNLIGAVVKKTSCKLWPEYHCAKITKDIYPGAINDIKVFAKNEEPDRYAKLSPKLPHVVSVTSEPNPPFNIITSWSNSNNLTIYWTHPNVTNGILTRFYIQVNSNKGDIVYTYVHTINSEDEYNLTYSHMISHLDTVRPCTEYTLRITSQNQKYYSKASTVSIATPPVPPQLTKELQVTSTNSTITVTLPEILYKYNIQIITGILSENLLQEKPNPFWEQHIGLPDEDLRKYKIVNHTSSRIIPSTIIIGNNITAKSNTFNISNTPLEPGTLYNVTIFFINKCNNQVRYITKEVGISTLGEKLAEKNNSSLHNGLYALILLFFLLSAILGFILYKKNRNESPVPKFITESVIKLFDQDRNGHEMESIPNETSQEKNPSSNIIPMTKKLALNPPVQQRLDVTYTKAIRINELESYVRDALQSDELLQQHSIFPRGHTKSCQYGSLSLNKPKNRYNNLVAYDHSRVILEKVNNKPYSDYINASYIDGYKAKQVYIATQGPKHVTLNDFWRMIWQENVSNIVMLANVYENSKKKVEKYWPDINEELQFNGITVQFISNDIFANFEYRIFNVTYNKMQRKINQLHFTSWPDHGVPLYSQSLVSFLQKLLKIPNDPTSPVVIHCSAGVGRTGTIILCDICLRMAAAEGRVDFLNTLERLRSQRANMVDNIEQYKLAHLIVLECLLGIKTAIACNEDMEKNVKKILMEDGIRTQMKYLDDTEWQDAAMRSVANLNDDLPNYPEKNRFNNIVPEKHSRIFMSRYPVDDESSTYINAVIVDGFCSPGRYVVTQQPLPNTLGDFWRFVAENESNVILSLNDINLSDKTSCKFWPENESVMNPTADISLKHIKTRDLDCYSIRTIEMCVKPQNNVTFIEMISYKDWPANSILPHGNIEQFLSFWEESDAILRRSNPVTVTCYNGSTACGLYIALSFIIEKMKLEHELDVCQAVRNIRHNRKQFITDKAQFEFLYEAAVKYINGFQSYANFN